MFLLLTTNTLFLTYYHFLTFNYSGKKTKFDVISIITRKQTETACCLFIYSCPKSVSNIYIYIYTILMTDGVCANTY